MTAKSEGDDLHKRTGDAARARPAQVAGHGPRQEEPDLPNQYRASAADTLRESRLSRAAAIGTSPYPFSA